MKKIVLITSLLVSCFASSQVRMTGTGISASNSSAFIDASSNATNNGTVGIGKGLVFPRVDLSTFTFVGSTGVPNNYPSRYDGMIVYNTKVGGLAGAGLTEGTLTEGYWYYYNKSNSVTGGTWKKLQNNGSTSVILNGTSYERAALTGDVTADVNSNTTSIAPNAVTSSKILDGTIVAADLNSMAASSGQVLTFNGSNWAPNTISEVDSIIGNEVADVVTNGGLTRLGAGTTIDPYKLKINDGTTNGQILTWDGTKWAAQIAAPSNWALAGNTGTNPTSNFVGTTDAQDLAFRTNNTEKVRVTNNGNVGIATFAPVSKLDVNGAIGFSTVLTSTNITLDNSHAIVRVNTSAGNVIVTLPEASAVPNRVYHIIKINEANMLTFSSTINAIGYTFTNANVPGVYSIQSDGVSWNTLK